MVFVSAVHANPISNDFKIVIEGSRHQE